MKLSGPTAPLRMSRLKPVTAVAAMSTPRTLAMRPISGFPLAEGETYCAILTRGVRDAEGRYLSVAPLGFDEGFQICFSHSFLP